MRKGPNFVAYGTYPKVVETFLASNQKARFFEFESREDCIRVYNGMRHAIKSGGYGKEVDARRKGSCMALVRIGK